MKLLNKAESIWLEVLSDVRETRDEGKLRKLVTEVTSKLNVVKNQFSSEAEKLFIEKFELKSDIILTLLMDVYVFSSNADLDLDSLVTPKLWNDKLSW